MSVERAPTIGTIRVTTNKTGKTLVFEAQCQVCYETYGPDSDGNCHEWLRKHLWDRHQLVIFDEDPQKLGRERWNEEVKPKLTEP